MPDLFLALVSAHPADATGAQADWTAAFGLAPHALNCHTLVHALARQAPQRVALCVPALHADAALRDALKAVLAAWQGPAALALFCEPLGAAEHGALAALGVQAWGDLRRCDAAAVQAVLAQADAQQAVVEAQRAELARVRGQMDERKWVDRAKGRLMSAAGIGEDEAFKLLRGAAMHVNLRLGEVSRAVVEAAQWAEALNRAGQLRMLSQRLVRVAAQLLDGVAPRRARTLRSQSVERVQQNLDHLAALTLEGAAAQALAQARSAWLALQAALPPRMTLADLPAADARAESLMEAAETLSAALEATAARRALRIVNLCGRQRMRAQRLAKDALLAHLLPTGRWAAQLAPTMDAFEATLRELEAAPLSSPEIRAALAAARDEWLRLVRGVQATGRAEGRAELVQASEALAEAFERLTASYEHSVQVIMS